MPQRPEPALRRLMPCLDALGITRLGDITGLDRVGIPVAQAVRPLGLANAVTQGKGTDLASAAVSAIMEAAEQFFAERIERLDTVIATGEELEVPFERFRGHVLPAGPARWDRARTAWVEARDLISGEPAWLPLELVHIAFSEPGLETDGLFAASTTGLACAFEETAATLHALLECIERDAIAKAQRTHGFFQRFRADISDVGDECLQALIDRVRTAGLLCAFWLAPATAGIPVVWCQIMEDGSQPLITPYPADGFAADTDPARAALRALLEAAQSRLAAISGARDDLTRASFPVHVDWQLVAAHRSLLANGPISLALAPEATGDAAANAVDVDGLAGRLARNGIGPLIGFGYDTSPFDSISAVRVMVPQFLPLSDE